VRPLPASYRLLPLVPPGVFYDVRIFLDTWNAPISEVGTAVLRVAAELDAFAIVVAANDQVGRLSSFWCCVLNLGGKPVASNWWSTTSCTAAWGRETYSIKDDGD
jgi:hypothetical protein